MGHGAVQGKVDLGNTPVGPRAAGRPSAFAFRLLSPTALLFSYLLLGALLALALLQRATPAVARAQLAEFPKELGGFHMIQESEIAPNILAILQPTDTVVRAYARQPGEPLVSLYIAYHADQSEGSRVHSPKSCLPGAGWQITTIKTIPLAWKGGESKGNLVRVEKGLDKQLALYWIHSNGRVVANEYVARAYIFHDLFARRRSDGGLVRFMTVFAPEEREESAKERLLVLAEATLQVISRYIPD